MSCQHRYQADTNGRCYQAAQLKSPASFPCGGSILLQGNSSWKAPGGGTAYFDPETGDNILVFHALNMSDHADADLWVKTMTWQNDWPVLN